RLSHNLHHHILKLFHFLRCFRLFLPWKRNDVSRYLFLYFFCIQSFIFHITDFLKHMDFLLPVASVSFLISWNENSKFIFPRSQMISFQAQFPGSFGYHAFSFFHKSLPFFLFIIKGRKFQVQKNRPLKDDGSFYFSYYKVLFYDHSSSKGFSSPSEAIS